LFHVYCKSVAEINWDIEVEANYTHLNHFSTATAIEHSNIFESVSIETYDDPGDIPHGDPIRFIIVIGPTSKDTSWSWSLWAPGSSASARLPGFDHSIKRRERQVNHWIDKLELTSLEEMALVYWHQSRFDEAEPLYRRALAIRENAVGPEHPDVLQSLNNLAELYRAQGKYSEAEPLHERALAIRERAQGPDRPDVLQSLNNQAVLYQGQGRYAEAEPLYQRALAIVENYRDASTPTVATILENYAALLRETEREDKAEELEARAKAIRAKSE
jgi:tetratricopeptide (TPR) repeat protein